MRQALDRSLAVPAWATVPAVAVSAVTGAGLPELRDALDRLVARAARPRPRRPGPALGRPVVHASGAAAPSSPARWPAGTLTAGQELLLTPSLRPARIRGLESMNEPVTSAAGVARVAVNLRGVPAGFAARGMALVEAGRWTLTRLIDVRLSIRDPEVTLPPEITLHIGSAAYAGPDPPARRRRRSPG